MKKMHLKLKKKETPNKEKKKEMTRIRSLEKNPSKKKNKIHDLDYSLVMFKIYLN